MKFDTTQSFRVAIRALLALEHAGSPMTARMVGLGIGVAPNLIPRSLGPLVARGWIHSAPGPTGGYRLAVSLDDISVLEVMEAVEGPIGAGRCIEAAGACSDDEPCALHRAWRPARAQLTDELAALRVSSLPMRAPASASPIGVTPSSGLRRG